MFVFSIAPLTSDGDKFKSRRPLSLKTRLDLNHWICPLYTRHSFSFLLVSCTDNSQVSPSPFFALLFARLSPLISSPISFIYCCLAAHSARNSAPRYPHGFDRCNLVPNSVYSLCVHCLPTSYPQPTPRCSISFFSSLLVYHPFTALRPSPFLFAQKSSCMCCIPAYLRSSLCERA